MTGSNKVLVYHHCSNGSPVVKNGLATIEQEELDQILHNNSHLRSSTKEIPRGAMGIEILQRDLLTPDQATKFDRYPNSNANIAGLTLPLYVVLGSALGGKYSELVILREKV
ncbi:hypothetical protein LTR56_004636 [Elasticomyces elasticus]|nr:hypothetical protein LTR56_004636 [Elasticomyces elasticus]KAK3659844.1 hypothetical protein LTR22_008211 [Elasticomyces elasticus]KAK4925976.1 hypothetical protein LTR49_007114 [Elasticomyces elasticus]KAK5768212.1 hypothetical protein LTS12_001696 [Elasticomyces elasticus]